MTSLGPCTVGAKSIIACSRVLPSLVIEHPRYNLEHTTEIYAMHARHVLVRVLRSVCCSITRITRHCFSRKASAKAVSPLLQQKE
jgi:hypothetical protein